MKSWALIAVVGLLVLVFQNCSDVKFQSGDSSSAAGTPDPGTGNESNREPDGGVGGPGLSNGHFDLDTASHVYTLGHGITDKHEHEYDDKYNVTFVDFFNMASGFTKIQDRVSNTQRFYIIVANAQLSPGGTLEINGNNYPVTEYQSKVSDFRNLLPTYSLSELTNFKIRFNRDAITQGGLIGTITSCVRRNDAGANGEYRNGALTIQILEAGAAALNSATGTASANGGLLWEATVFWHHEGDCY